MRVSKNTLEILEHLKKALGDGSIDEVIQVLIKQHRKSMLETAIGLDQGRLTQFTEEDRG
nr:VapB-type antitoxin [Candidatus Freyarchaeota archaeon]